MTSTAVAVQPPEPTSVLRLPSPTTVEVAPSLVTLSEPHGVPAEAIRALRTQIQSQHLQAGRRALAVCEAAPQNGCTFVASNLAVALSQIGISTLLVDANLREPRIDQIIRRDSTLGGLSECLGSANTSVTAYVEDNVLPNLSVLYAGGPAPNAQELLASQRFEAVIDTCLRTYDATIVDTPPANSCADALRVANVVGYSLVVARRHRSLLSDVRHLIEQLRDAHSFVVGTVLDRS